MIAAPTARYNRIGPRIYKYIYKDASHRVDSFTETSIDKLVYQEFKMRILIIGGVVEALWCQI